MQLGIYCIFPNIEITEGIRDVQKNMINHPKETWPNAVVTYRFQLRKLE